MSGRDAAARRGTATEDAGTTARPDGPAPAVAGPAPPARPAARALVSLAVALAGVAALLVSAPGADRAAAPPGRAGAADAWPDAQRADIPAHLPDGPVYQPLLFLDARTSVGTAPGPDGRSLRLVLRAADGSVRQLRRLPLADDPAVKGAAVGGDALVWVETTGRAPASLWTAPLRGGGPARRLVADVGDVLFHNSPHDLVVAGGRVHWAVAAPDGAAATGIRSVPVTGGGVRLRTEAGTWAMRAWPWLAEESDEVAGTTRLRNLETGRDVTVAAPGVQPATCSPAWCRAVVPDAGDAVRIDLVRPDGSARRRVAGGAARPAIGEVAVLDRFEVLSEPGPRSDLTGTAALLVHDIATGRTVDLGSDVGNPAYGNGVLWWSTGFRDDITWHSLDLRTV